MTLMKDLLGVSIPPFCLQYEHSTIETTELTRLALMLLVSDVWPTARIWLKCSQDETSPPTNTIMMSNTNLTYRFEVTFNCLVRFILKNLTGTGKDYLKSKPAIASCSNLSTSTIRSIRKKEQHEVYCMLVY